MKDFNFIHKRLWNDKAFIDKTLGPFTGKETFVEIDDTWTWETIWVHVGLFPSKGQARKNGHGGKIAKGFSDTVTKKKRGIMVTVMNDFDE